jgi:diphthamide synthase (EF-2-diphthine--ammonia ligase)
VYEAIMNEVMLAYRNDGLYVVAFGDLFLEDLRAWREANLGRAGMRGIFPVWNRDSAEFAQELIAFGYKAILTCTDHRAGAAFVGREYDQQLLSDLPTNIDPCGENGEFHSFVYDGPIFERPVSVRVGEIVERGDRHYADLLPR